MSFIKYDPKLKERARKLRSNSTLSEITLWKELRGGKMLGYTFNRQKPLNKYIVDFFNAKLKLVIEIDGDSHDGKEDYDKRRQDKLESLGCTFIRFYDHDVMKHTEGVLYKIEETIKELEKQKNIPSPKEPNIPPCKGG